jgi:xanthine dehydrogenase large subunit
MPSSLGTPVPHESAWRHVSGEALFIDDMPEPPDLLFGVTLPSPHAHARILASDAAEALSIPGVHAVLFAKDVPGANNVGSALPDEPLLAQDEVFCVGQAVALVVAEKREIALGALARIRVEYAPLPAISSLAEGIAAGSFIGEPHRLNRGDVEAALAAAPHKLAGTFDSGSQEHFYLETHCALAVPGEDRSLTVWSSTQHPSEVQLLIARNLGWTLNRVVVCSPRMGGAFGGKETQGAHWANLAAVAAVHTGRPTKVWLDRVQDMTQTGHRHPFHTSWEVSFDDRGRVLAFRAHLFADAGWAADLSLPILDRAMLHADNAYYFPAVEITGRAVRTSFPSNTAFRGFGAPQGLIVAEHVMERIAAFLGVDPLEVRKGNLYGEKPRDRTPYGEVVENWRIPRMIDQLAISSDLAARKAAISDFNARNRWLKRGIALTPVKFGISFNLPFLNQAGALVLVYDDGTVQLNHGGTEMGQGLYTKMMQVCGHELRLPLAHIRHMPTSTEKVPNTAPTAASAGADLNGQAVKDACMQIVARLLPVAASLLGVAERDVNPGFADRWATAGDRAVGFAEVCHAAHLQRIPLSATGFYRTPDIWYDRKTGQGRPFHYFAQCAAVSEVEVDGLTGEWRLRRVDILHDAGDSLSPDVDRGQVEGGFLQGLGWLGSEELVWDQAGHLLSSSPSTYKIPSVGDAPLDFRVSFLAQATQPGVIHGSKAVGEPPLMLAVSAWCALGRAVSAFGPVGTEVHLPVPATVEAVLRGVDRARGA